MLTEFEHQFWARRLSFHNITGNANGAPPDVTCNAHGESLMLKRIGRILCITATLFVAPPMVADPGERVFMYVRDGSRDLDLMLREEVGVMRSMLTDAGYIVDIATPNDAPMSAAGSTLQPTIKLDAVDIADYVGVILPCMAPASGHTMPATVEALAARAVELGLPIAASRGSVTTLANVGALRGHRYAAFAGAAEREEFADGEFLGTGVVRDRKISTAGICPLAARSLGEPDGTVELTTSFIAALEDRG